MSQTALVISGGGSKGAFAVGVLKAMFQHRPDLSFDLVVGTSTGALIAPLAAVENMALLEQLYTTTTNEQVLVKGNVGHRFLTADSIFDGAPLARTISHYYTDDFYARLRAQNRKVCLATVCLQTKASVYFCSHPIQPVTDAEVKVVPDANQFRRAVAASAFQPVFMSPIEVAQGSLPLRQYVDGGVREYAGVQLAIEQGADEVFVILHSSAFPEVTEKRYDKMPDILMRTLDIFIYDVGVNDLTVPGMFNNALGYLQQVRQNMRDAGMSEPEIDRLLEVPGSPYSNRRKVNLHIIRPDGPLGGGPGGLNFDPEEMKGMLAKGKQEMNTYIAGLPPGRGIFA